ncbi:MAG: thioredoxin [Bacilli bacterium]
MLKHIQSLAEFEKEVQNNPHVLVDFYADWCGPCRMLGPVLDQIAEEHPGLAILKVNVDLPENRIVAQKFSVSSIPTMVQFKDGKAVDTKVGFVPKAPLVRWLGL